MTEARKEDTYTVINDRTGEIVPVNMLIERVPKEYWERSYARLLAEYIGAGGNITSNVLAWLIKNKDSNNRIVGTFAFIAKECSTSVPTVSTLFQKLYKKGMLKKVRNGVYMLSPSLLRHGGANKGAILFKKWDDC